MKRRMNHNHPHQFNQKDNDYMQWPPKDGIDLTMSKYSGGQCQNCGRSTKHLNAYGVYVCSFCETDSFDGLI